MSVDELGRIHQTLDDHAAKLGRVEHTVTLFEQAVPRIIAHIDDEELHKVEVRESFIKGEIRMDTIESDLSSLKTLVSMFEGFAKSVKIITYLGSAIIAMFLWILFEKNQDIKDVQQTILVHTIALEKLVVGHNELEKDFKHEISRVDRDIIRGK